MWENRARFSPAHFPACFVKAFQRLGISKYVFPLPGTEFKKVRMRGWIQLEGSLADSSVGTLQEVGRISARPWAIALPFKVAANLHHLSIAWWFLIGEID